MNTLIVLFRRFPLGVLLAVSLTLLLQSCQGQATPTPFPTATPELAALFPTRPNPTDPEVVRTALSATWNDANYQEYDTFDGRHIGEWSTFLVSSGQFAQVQSTLSTGETVQVDVVFAYQIAQTQAILTLPVVIGMQTGETYLYFSPEAAYAGEAPGAFSFTKHTRAAALADAQTRLPEGQVFSLTLAEYVNREEFIWTDCPAFAERMAIPATYCTLGQDLDTLYPLQARFLTMRTLTDVSPAWFVFGFWFYEQETPDA